MIARAPLTTRLSAFWLAWKYVLLVLVLLAVSLYANYRQFVASIEAPLKIENAALTEAVERMNLIERDRTSDDLKTAQQLETIAQRIPEGMLGYLQAAARKPLPPTCAPGQERIDAVNRILGEP